MYLFLLWALTLLALVLFICASWAARRRDGSPNTPAGIVGSLLALVVAAAPVSLAIWAEIAGFRPGHAKPLLLWWGLLALGVVIAAAVRFKLPAGAAIKLLGGSLVAGLLALLVLLLTDRARRAEVERQLEEAMVICRDLQGTPRPGEDARPVYKELPALFAKAGITERLGGWAAVPEAVLRQDPGRLGRRLAALQPVLDTARKARLLPAFSRDPGMEGPVMGRQQVSKSEQLSIALADLILLVGARAVGAAQAQDLATAQDSIDWLGDLARQMIRGPTLLHLLLGMSAGNLRWRVIEAVLADTAQRGVPAALRVEPIPRELFVEALRRHIRIEAAWDLRIALEPYGDRASLEELLGNRFGAPAAPGLTARLLTGAYFAFYRVFALPCDVAALRSHEGEALRRLEGKAGSEGLSPTPDEMLALGSGPFAGLLVNHLYSPRRLMLQAETAARVARTGVALQAHRAQHAAYPERLEDVARELLPEVPRDAWYDQPLRYERLPPDGAVVWSAWDGGDTSPSRAPTAGGSWKTVREQSRELVFFLGSAWKDHGQEPRGQAELEEDEEDAGGAAAPPQVPEKR